MPSIINAALSGGLISTGDTSGQLQLQTVGTTAITVTSAQNVGIGTSSPTSKLQSQTSSSGSSPNMLSLVNNTGGAANATGVKLWMSGRAAQADADRGTYIESVTTDTNNAHAMVFATSASGTAPTERARFNTTGAFVFAGGTTTADGIGITFPATQSASSNANTLDDYDEYTASSSACTGALTVSVVWKLTKVGNVVALTLPPTFGTCVSANSSWTYGVLLPAKYRPATTLTFPVGLKDNGSVVTGIMGMIYITTGGEIRVYKSFNGTDTFTNATTIGIAQDAGTSISWII